MTRRDVPHALFRLLLRMYPPDFRSRFGTEMLATLSDATLARPAGFPRFRFVTRTSLGLLRHALAERFSKATTDASPERMSTMTLATATQDFRYALRSLRRRPGFLATVIVTLALGIGANTAVFSLIDAVLLRPLPIAQPNEVVSIYQAYNATSVHGRVAYPTYEAMRERARMLSDLAGYNTVDASVVIGSRAAQHTVATVSGNYFATLGLVPTHGRLLLEQDDNPAAANVVVLSDRIWASEFDRDPAAVGKSIRFGEHIYTVVGVAPAGFRGTSLAESPAFWVPISKITVLGEGGLFSGEAGRDVMATFSFGWVGLVGRLRAGSTREAAARELEQILLAVHEERSETRALANDVQQHVSVIPAIEAAALSNRGDLMRFVSVVLAVVVMTMLIACLNVANLLMVRSHERARELGLRSALGAARARIAWQLLLESLILGVMGAGAGLAVAIVTMKLVSTFSLPGGIDLRSLSLGIDARVLVFTAALGILTALVFGLLPALRASRVDLSTMLRGHSRSSRGGPRSALIVVQVSLSALLLVGAALFARSLRAGLTTDLGFDPSPLAAISVDPGLNGYDAVRTRRYIDEAIEAAQRIPGVQAAAMTTLVPLAPVTSMNFKPEGGRTGADGGDIRAGFVHITPDYFRTLGVPLVQGRSLTSEEIGYGGRDTSARRIVINTAAAEAFWPNENPIGRRIILLGSIQMVVVGVVDDTKYASVRDDARPVVFAPLRTRHALSLVVRSSDPESTLPALQRAIAALDPDMPLRDARVVSTQLDAVLMPQRFGTLLLGIFSIVALCVAAVGIYGVSSYSVTQRIPELGIRIALGAQRGDVLRSVLRRTAPAALLGIASGIAIAALTTRWLDPFLFGITPRDWIAFGGASLALGIVAMLASWVPARRATRIDPLAAIRAETG